AFSATTNGRADVRAEPAARAMASRCFGRAVGRNAIEHPSHFLLELIRRRPIEIQLPTNRIVHRPHSLSAGREVRKEVRFARSAQSLDALEMMRSHREHEVGVLNQLARQRLGSMLTEV